MFQTVKLKGPFSFDWEMCGCVADCVYEVFHISNSEKTLYKDIEAVTTGACFQRGEVWCWAVENHII